MNLLGSALLLADRSLFRDMGAGFREKREHFDALDVLLWILLAIGFFVFVGLLSWLLARQRQASALQQPAKIVPHALPRSPVGSARSLAAGADRSGRRDRSAGAAVSRAGMFPPRAVASGIGRKARRDRGFGGPLVSAGGYRIAATRPPARRIAARLRTAAVGGPLIDDVVLSAGRVATVLEALVDRAAGHVVGCRGRKSAALESLPNGTVRSWSL